MDGYELVAVDYHLAAAHPFKVLDLLFALLNLPLRVFVAEQINFSLTIRYKSAISANQPDIRPAETTLVGAHFSMLCILERHHFFPPLV